MWVRSLKITKRIEWIDPINSSHTKNSKSLKESNLLFQTSIMSLPMFHGRDTVPHDMLVSVGQVKVPQSLVRNEYSVYDVLGIAVELAERHYYREAVHTIEVAESMALYSDSPTPKNIILATWSHVLHYKIKYSEKEYLIPVIKSNLASLVPGASWVEPYSKDDRRPDVIVTIDGKLAVGEVKPKSFSKAHLKQLRECMRKFDTSIGFAFAESLTTMLPDNVTFVNMTGLKDRHYRQPL